MSANCDQFIGFFMLMQQESKYQKVCTINSWTEDGSMWQVISHCILLKQKTVCATDMLKDVKNTIYIS